MRLRARPPQPPTSVGADGAVAVPLCVGRGRRPRPRPLDVVCVGALLGQALWSPLSVVLVPGLIGTRPVLLEVVNASVPAMVGAGAFVGVGRASFLTALLAPLVLWVPLDAVAWWAGRRYGRAVVDVACRWRPQLRGPAQRGDRLLGRFGLWILLVEPWLPIPDLLVFAGLGEARVPLWRFVLGDALGLLARAAIVVGLGTALGGHAVAVTTQVSRYALMIVAVGSVLAGGWLVRRARRRRRGCATACTEADVPRAREAPGAPHAGAERSTRVDAPLAYSDASAYSDAYSEGRIGR